MKLQDNEWNCGCDCVADCGNDLVLIAEIENAVCYYEVDCDAKWHFGKAAEQTKRERFDVVVGLACFSLDEARKGFWQPELGRFLAFAIVENTHNCAACCEDARANREPFGSQSAVKEIANEEAKRADHKEGDRAGTIDIVSGEIARFATAMFTETIMIKQNKAAQTQLQRSLSYSGQDHSRDA